MGAVGGSGLGARDSGCGCVGFCGPFRATKATNRKQAAFKRNATKDATSHACASERGKRAGDGRSMPSAWRVAPPDCASGPRPGDAATSAPCAPRGSGDERTAWARRVVAAVTANAAHAVEVKQTEALAQRIVRTWAGMRCRNGLIVEFNDVQLDVLSAAMRCNSKACRFYMVKYLSKDTTDITASASVLADSRRSIEPHPSKAEDAGEAERTGKHFVQRVLNSPAQRPPKAATGRAPGAALPRAAAAGGAAA